MSGGSFNYLCFKDSLQLLSGESDTDLQSMADRLAQLGYANDAAKETESLLLELRQARNRLQSRIDRLSNLWKSVEWWDSFDSDEDSVINALKTYRGEV